MEYETITRHDGITYQRKKRNNNFDCSLNIRFHKEKIEVLKKIALKKETNYNEMLRNIIDDFIEKEQKKY